MESPAHSLKLDPISQIQSLFDQGSNVQVDASVPVKRYFRAGMEMLKMAGVYEEEGALENAYILYIRYITLFVEKIGKHPEYQIHPSVDKSNVKKKLKETLPKAEKLKIRLKKKFEDDFKEFVAYQKELEEKLKRTEENRCKREKLESSTPHKGIVDQEQGNANHLRIAPYDGNIPEDTSLGRLAYPTELLAEDLPAGVVAEREKEIVPAARTDVAAPMPSRELKPASPQSVPIVNRGTKPLSLMSANHDHKGGKLRPILVPQQIMEKFLSLAFSNTSRNVETCGILAGKLSLNKFVITHLLIPQQVGTADSCTTQHEEELFDQQDKYDLITLGWIHTHPSQTAFLSSVDLHTHCSYQLMMPEAVAIVCAPKFKETGYFTLTPSHGLNYIANCRKDGFHPHPSEPPLFQSADHIIMDSSLTIQVIDLRR